MLWRVLLASALLAGRLGAQGARDSVVFRAGQWANEVATNANAVSFGALRFSSPRRAWLVDAGFQRERTTEERSRGGEDDDRRDGLQVQLGHRWYRPLGARVYRFATLGLTGSVARSHDEFGVAYQDQRSSGVGVFGDVGATWLATRHVGLGAAWTARLARYRGRNTTILAPSPLGDCEVSPCPPRTSRYDHTYLTLGDVRLRATFYY